MRTTRQGSLPDDAPDALYAAVGLTAHDVVAMARSELGDPHAVVDGWRVEPVDYAFGSPTTGGLLRLGGVARTVAGRARWSLFVKVVQSYRHWPMLDRLPPELREQALTSPAWRYEADVYASGLADVLPRGLRLPRVHAIRDLGGEHLALVLEDVRTAATPWDAARFRRAAHLLGRMAVRLTRSDVLPATASRIAGEVTRRYVTSRVETESLPALRADALWSHPALATSTATALRADMLALVDRLPGLVEDLEALPQLMVHGDASPQNLLVPAEDPDTFVAVDWSLAGLSAVGDDLGQLIVGLAHAGAIPAAGLGELRDVVVPAYTAGLTAEGFTADEAEVRLGLDGGLVVRSAFASMPYQRLSDPLTPDLLRLLDDRLALTRYLVDLGLRIPVTPSRPGAVVADGRRAGSHPPGLSPVVQSAHDPRAAGRQRLLAHPPAGARADG